MTYVCVCRCQGASIGGVGLLSCTRCMQQQGPWVCWQRLLAAWTQQVQGIGNRCRPQKQPDSAAIATCPCAGSNWQQRLAREVGQNESNNNKQKLDQSPHLVIQQELRGGQLHQQRCTSSCCCCCCLLVVSAACSCSVLQQLRLGAHSCSRHHLQQLLA